MIYLDTSVRTGEDYGVNVSVTHASNAVELLGSDVTIWGVPGDPRHDKSRGWQCLLGGGHLRLLGIQHRHQLAKSIHRVSFGLHRP